MMSNVIIIAEAGVNHNGDLSRALALIEAAAEAGANYVKFQTFKAEKLVNRNAQKADYQKKNMPGDEITQFAMLRKLEMADHWYPNLIEKCIEKNIGFLSSAFDLDSIELLREFNLPFWKIPSGEITNLPYLRKVGQYASDVILSSGMCNMQEIQEAISILTANGVDTERITVLHCNTEYPTPFEHVNLNAMLEIREQLGVRVGYSDHTLGIEVPIAAVALGALVIEKHFTLDRNMEGPDHKASLEPYELEEMIIAIRHIEAALGSKIKAPTASEEKNIIIARKSIHTAKVINAGDVITEQHLIMKRPGDGISPMRMAEIVGKKALYNIPEDHKISLLDIE